MRSLLARSACWLKDDRHRHRHYATLLDATLLDAPLLDLNLDFDISTTFFIVGFILTRSHTHSLTQSLTPSHSLTLSFFLSFFLGLVLPPSPLFFWFVFFGLSPSPSPFPPHSSSSSPSLPITRDVGVSQKATRQPIGMLFSSVSEPVGGLATPSSLPRCHCHCCFCCFCCSGYSACRPRLSSLFWL